MDELDASNENNADTGSDDDFEDRNLLKRYVIPKKGTAKTLTNLQKSNSIHATSSELKEQIPKSPACLTYNDIENTSKNELKYVIHHPLQYNAPIYQDPAFQRYTLKEKVKLLCSYHTKLSQIVTEQSRLQLEHIPLPKAIKPSKKCASSVLKRDDGNNSDESGGKKNDVFDELLNSQQDYICRSGRITKRKFYSENVADLELKKPKVEDDEWSENIKMSDSLNSSRNKSSLNLHRSFDTKVTPKKNLDIINRSSLFREKESVKSGRLARIADGVEQQNKKHIEEAAKLEKFENSLASEEFEQINYEESEKKRVIPPMPKLKGAKAKKKEQYNELEVTVQKGKPQVQNQKPTTGRQTQQKVSKSFTEEASTSTSTAVNKRSNKKMVQCPICSRDFGESEIEEHASSCGENMMETRSNAPTVSTITTCRMCDKVFVYANEYERHLESCNSRSPF